MVNRLHESSEIHQDFRDSSPIRSIYSQSIHFRLIGCPRREKFLDDSLEIRDVYRSTGDSWFQSCRHQQCSQAHTERGIMYGPKFELWNFESWIRRTTVNYWAVCSIKRKNTDLKIQFRILGPFSNSFTDHGFFIPLEKQKRVNKKYAEYIFVIILVPNFAANTRIWNYKENQGRVWNLIDFCPYFGLL